MTKPSTSDDYPSAFNGGEQQDEDKRVGETRPNSPDITEMDPAHTEPGLEHAKPEKK